MKSPRVREYLDMVGGVGGVGWGWSVGGGGVGLWSGWRGGWVIGCRVVRKVGCGFNGGCRVGWCASGG